MNQTFESHLLLSSRIGFIEWYVFVFIIFMLWMQQLKIALDSMRQTHEHIECQSQISLVMHHTHVKSFFPFR